MRESFDPSESKFKSEEEDSPDDSSKGLGLW